MAPAKIHSIHLNQLARLSGRMISRIFAPLPFTHSSEVRSVLRRPSHPSPFASLGDNFLHARADPGQCPPTQGPDRPDRGRHRGWRGRCGGPAVAVRRAESHRRRSSCTSGRADLGLFQADAGDPTSSVLPLSLLGRVRAEPWVAQATPLQLVIGAIKADPSAIVLGVDPRGFAARQLVYTAGHGPSRDTWCWETRWPASSAYIRETRSRRADVASRWRASTTPG